MVQNTDLDCVAQILLLSREWNLRLESFGASVFLWNQDDWFHWSEQLNLMLIFGSCLFRTFLKNNI